jgi:abhydrolase domain-containing protein 6
MDRKLHGVPWKRRAGERRGEGSRAGERDVEDRWVDVDGMKIHCLDSDASPEPAARPGSRVLLMLHGWSGSAEDFHPLFGFLAPDVRAIAVDLPGSGFSAKPDASYDLEFFLSFLQSLCRALGLTRLVLIGHSMGGQFAAHFVSRWPALVERLILIAPYGLNGQEGFWLTLARWGALVDFAFRLNTRLFIRWTLRVRVLYKPTAERLTAALDSTARSILGRESSRAIARTTRGVIGHGYVEGLLPRIRHETFVIWGDRDRVLAPRWAERFLALLPNARGAVLADAGHMPMVDKPEQTAALINDFLTRA